MSERNLFATIEMPIIRFYTTNPTQAVICMEKIVQ